MHYFTYVNSNCLCSLFSQAASNNIFSSTFDFFFLSSLFMPTDKVSCVVALLQSKEQNFQRYNENITKTLKLFFSRFFHVDDETCTAKKNKSCSWNGLIPINANSRQIFCSVKSLSKVSTHTFKEFSEKNQN